MKLDEILEAMVPTATVWSKRGSSIQKNRVQKFDATSLTRRNRLVPVEKSNGEG